MTEQNYNETDPNKYLMQNEKPISSIQDKKALEITMVGSLSAMKKYCNEEEINKLNSLFNDTYKTENGFNIQSAIEFDKTSRLYAWQHWDNDNKDFSKEVLRKNINEWFETNAKREQVKEQEKENAITTKVIVDGFDYKELEHNPEQYMNIIKEIAQNHAPFLGNIKACAENALDEITSKSVDEYLAEINVDASEEEYLTEAELLNQVEILNNGLDYLNGKENCIRPTAEQMKWGLDDGLEWKQVLTGYVVFDNSDNLDSKTGNHKKTLTISRFDIMDTFDGDLSAALQAEKDGIKLIPLDQYSIEPKDNTNCYRFLDTPENHQFLQEKSSEYSLLNHSTTHEPLHKEDFFHKEVQRLDKLINKSAKVKINGIEHKCDGLLKGYAESITENEKLQKKLMGLEESYKQLSNLYQSQNKKNLNIELSNDVER